MGKRLPVEHDDLEEKHPDEVKLYQLKKYDLRTHETTLIDKQMTYREIRAYISLLDQRELNALFIYGQCVNRGRQASFKFFNKPNRLQQSLARIDAESQRIIRESECPAMKEIQTRMHTQGLTPGKE